jgi:protein-tyrosine phosphatase
MVAWPNFGLPPNAAAVFDLVRRVHDHATDGELVEIACYGGVGRTGTFLSCLAIVTGIRPRSAVA